MALIKCPECGREISDQAEICIHCGYPIKAKREEQQKLDEQKLEEKKRDKAEELKLRISEIEKIQNQEDKKAKLIKMAEETNHWRAYNQLGLLFFNINDLENAKRYFEKAAKGDYAEPNDMEYVYTNIGHTTALMANSDASLWEDAIQILDKRKTVLAMYVLGQIYDPDLKVFNYPNKGVGKSIYYFARCNYMYQSENRPTIEQIVAMSNLSVLFGNHRKEYILAAASSFLAYYWSNGKIGKNNYNVYRSEVEKEYGTSWVSEIEKLRYFKEVQELNSRFKQSISDNGHNYHTTQSLSENRPKCPTCGSFNIVAISGTRRFLSTGLFGIGSSDIGKTMRCKNCGYKW